MIRFLVLTAALSLAGPGFARDYRGFVEARARAELFVECLDRGEPRECMAMTGGTLKQALLLGEGSADIAELRRSAGTLHDRRLSGVNVLRGGGLSLLFILQSEFLGPQSEYLLLHRLPNGDWRVDDYILQPSGHRPRNTQPP